MDGLRDDLAIPDEIRVSPVIDTRFLPEPRPLAEGKLPGRLDRGVLELRVGQLSGEQIGHDANTVMPEVLSVLSRLDGEAELLEPLYRFDPMPAHHVLGQPIDERTGGWREPGSTADDDGERVVNGRPESRRR